MEMARTSITGLAQLNVSLWMFATREYGHQQTTERK